MQFLQFHSSSSVECFHALESALYLVFLFARKDRFQNVHISREIKIRTTEGASLISFRSTIVDIWWLRFPYLSGGVMICSLSGHWCVCYFSFFKWKYVPVMESNLLKLRLLWSVEMCFAHMLVLYYCVRYIGWGCIFHQVYCFSKVANSRYVIDAMKEEWKDWSRPVF